ncbi:MAG: SDR family NAD(P)-dependent oxidoreductase, partial [Chitinivibrionales bacterium]|nr:SDR family NAD(P)-dependent oxidoreductase [Chitinivibrionales bacterium]
MTSPVQNKTALITGASRGIGKSIAVHLAGRGIHVVACARSSDRLESLAKEIRNAGGTITTAVADVSREQDVAALFDTIATNTEKLDILINNAGIGLFGDIADFPA